MSAVHSDAASEPTRAIAPRWLTRIDDAILAVVIVLTAVFFVCVVLQVFVRYVLEQPLPWTEEVARYSFIWASFLTASVIVGRREHFAIDFLVEALPLRPRLALQAVGTAACLGFTLILIYYGSNWAWRLMIATSPILELPQGTVYAIIPIAAAHMSLHLAVQLAEYIHRFRMAGAAS